MEENNETTPPPTTPDAPPAPEVAPTSAPSMEAPAAPDGPPVPVDVAPPTEVAPADTSEVTASEKTPLVERLGAPASRLRTLQGPSVVGLAVATFVFLVTSVLLALMVFAPAIAPFRLGTAKSGAIAERDLAIEKVAVRFAHNFMTFDYRTLDANLTSMAQDATGKFSSQVVSLRKDKTVTGALIAQQATSRGSVEGQSVESVHGDTATVRVFLNQVVTNKSQQQGRSTFRVFLFTLVKTAQGWKVDNVS